MPTVPYHATVLLWAMLWLWPLARVGSNTGRRTCLVAGSFEALCPDVQTSTGREVEDDTPTCFLSARAV